MALPVTSSRPWMNSFEQPLGILARQFGLFDDYELYQEEDRFVLTLEVPGFDLDEMHVAWDDGVLNVGAEHADDEFGRQKTFHRRFRFPADVDDDAIEAEYKNGILSIVLPLEDGITIHGTEIPVTG